MASAVSFKDHVIVSCGTMIPELEHLRKSGFLDAERIPYTKPGRHEVPGELESQLIERIRLARKQSDKIIVVYGGTFCYVNTTDLFRTIETIIDEQGPRDPKNSRHALCGYVDQHRGERRNRPRQRNLLDDARVDEIQPLRL